MDQIINLENIKKPRNRKSYGRLCDVAKKLRAQTHETGDDCMCSKLKCFKNITLEERLKIIKDFNNLGTYDAQNLYLSGLITIQLVKRRRSRKSQEEAKFHSYSYKYKVFLTRNGQIVEVPICYKAMISLHGITSRRIQHIQTQMTTHGKITPDGRGKHKNRPHSLKNRTEAKEYIQSLQEEQGIQETEFVLHEGSKSIQIPSIWKYLQSKNGQPYVETHSVSDQLASCHTQSEEYRADQSNDEGAIQETEQSADVIKEEIDDDIFAESQDELLLTKEEILTLVSETNNEKVAAADLVKEEPDSEDENEPAIKRSRVEYSQLSTDLDQPGPSHELNQPGPSHDFDRPSPNHDFDQPGPSRLATTDELQTPLASSNDVTHMSNDVALDNLLNYSGDLNMFFKTILSVAQKLDPVDQVILQRNITNAVFDIKIKEMTNKKS